jgi:hypothetical protein
MANDPQRLEKLSFAGSYCLFDKKLQSSGTGSIVWGVLNLLIGGALLAANDIWGAISGVLGLALIVAGIYEKRVRDPKVIIISVTTLAVLALWNFALIALAAMGKVRLLLGGRTLFWAIAQAWGAYATWKTYHTYKMLCEKSDPLTVQQVRGYIDELKKAKPGQNLELIQFEANAGFLQATKQYRLKPVEDLFLIARYKSQLGSLQLEEISFLPRIDVTVTPVGEKWMSKKIKATIDLGPLKLDKVSITAEMAARLNPTASMIPMSVVPPPIG